MQSNRIRGRRPLTLRLSKKVSLRDDYNGALPHTPPKGYYPFGIPFM